MNFGRIKMRSLRGVLHSDSNRFSRDKRRLDTEEEIVNFEEDSNPNDCLKEVIVHLARQDETGKARCLAYLNALVRYHKRIIYQHDILYSHTEIIFCLKGCLLSKYSVVRAAAMRCLRYVINDATKVELFFKFKLDWCLARSLDLYYSHDVERNQAVRLCRHLIHVSAKSIQPSIIFPFIAIANDGTNTKERLVLTALELLCELAYSNAQLLAECGGVQVLVQHIILCHDNPRVNEALTQTLLYLMNDEKTRESCMPSCGIDQLLGPFTDAHYRHKNDCSEGSARKEERLLRCEACSAALVSALHTWPGLVSLGNPTGTGITSLVNSLQMSSTDTQKIILELLFKVFLLRVPVYTDSFEEALRSCDVSSPDHQWKLREGFVAAECLSIYKASCSRPNLIDNHLALLISVFITNGILETLCQVVIESESHNSIWATILLGELLYMSYLLLPWTDSEHTQYLPTLVAASSSLSISNEQRLQANQAVTYLDRIHSLKKRGCVPWSLHLELLVSYIPEKDGATGKHGSKSNKDKDKMEAFLPQDDEDNILELIRDSLVLVGLDSSHWNWNLVDTILKTNANVLRRIESHSLNRFIEKLLCFYNPGNDKGFCLIRTSDSEARLYSSTGLLLIEKILQLGVEEPLRLLKGFLIDLCLCLNEIRQEFPDQEARLGLNNIFNYCCQDYFLFIGKLSSTEDGLVMLESTGIMQQLLDLVTITSHDTYVKLIVSSLDYTKDGKARIVLSKALTATSENARLYTADFMRALLRIDMPYFSSWCMELLVTQLYDQNKAVAMRSLSVINEACEDRANLLSLISTRPSVLHLGEMGSLLVIRYLSAPEGFRFLQSSHYLEKELDLWHQKFSERYVDVVEEMLAESLSSYEKNYDDETVIQRRSSTARQIGQSVYIPPHLYGQLVQHTDGTDIVANLPYLHEYFDILLHHTACDCHNIKQSKAAIWAAGHIGSSVFGLPILDKQDIIPELVHIAEEAKTLSLRGTAYYALGLIASTQAGVARLAEYGWRSVMSHRSEEWPILTEEALFLDSDTVREKRSRSSGSNASQTSMKSEQSSADEGARSRASTDIVMEEIRVKRNRNLFQNSTYEDEIVPAKDGKAHSTSELEKVKPGHHFRSSSDGLRSMVLTKIPSFEVEDTSQQSSLTRLEVSDMDTDEKSVSDYNRLDVPRSALKESNRDTIVLQSLDDMEPSKVRSLSWGKDVISKGKSTRSSSAQSTTTLSSRVSSADSVISKTPPNGRVDADTNSTEHLMIDTSLVEIATPKRIQRKQRFRSLQNYSSGMSASGFNSLPRGMYLSRRDEFGLAVVKAMRRQASVTSNDSNHGSSPVSAAPRLRSRPGSMARTLSVQGDIETLQEAHRKSDIRQPTFSSTLKYMGLALPLDVTMVFELDDGLMYDDDEKFSTLTMDSYNPVSQATDGLELHSALNCIACVSKETSSVMQRPDGDERDASANLSESLSRHYAGSPSGDSKAAVGRTLLRKECIKFVTTISSSIGVSSAEEGLLRLREQFPDLFHDVCLYSEISAILSTFSYHLPARRFIQELFQDIRFSQFTDDLLLYFNLNKDGTCCEKHLHITRVDPLDE